MAALKSVLFSTHTHPHKMPPIRILPNQIIAGPNWTTEETSGRLCSLRLSEGAFDFHELFNGIPAGQKPDMFIATVDAGNGCMPHNISFFCGPKILLVGDTHHLSLPISRLINYCNIERYDHVVVMHTPQHLHWLLESGIGQSICIPNVNVFDYNIQPPEHRKAGIVFVGQKSKEFHVTRAGLIRFMEKKKLPLKCLEVHVSEAAKIFSENQISFNCSLNGDLNMRIFEILSGGGCLVTDRLGSAAGLDRMFENEKHFFDYEDDRQLVDILKALLKNPDLCKRVSESGRRHYLSKYSEDIRRKQILGLAIGADVNLMPQDPRCSQNLEGFGVDVKSRLNVYEYVQELTAKGLTPRVLLDVDLGLRKIMDYSDLTRAQKYVFGFNDDGLGSVGSLKKDLENLCSGDRYDFPKGIDRPFDIAILSPRTIIRRNLNLCQLSNIIAILDGDQVKERHALSMRCFGYSALRDFPWVFKVN